MLARERIEKEIQEETTLYNAGKQVKRRYMDIGTIKRALAMCEAKTPSSVVEDKLSLQRGSVERMRAGTVIGLPSGELLTDKDRDDGFMRDV